MFNILSSLVEWNPVWLSGAVAHLLQGPTYSAFRDIIFAMRFESVVELLFPFYRLDLLWPFSPSLFHQHANLAHRINFNWIFFYFFNHSL